MSFIGILNGQVVFNVADDLVNELYEIVKAEDAEMKKSHMQSLIQMFASISLWLPKKVFGRYWTRRHVIILPSWAFNKLILGNSRP